MELNDTAGPAPSGASIDADSDRDLVGNYVRWTVGGRTVLILPHHVARDYGSVEAQTKIKNAKMAGAIAQCLCVRGGIDVSCFQRIALWIISALPYTAGLHECELLSQGGHPKGSPTDAGEHGPTDSRRNLRVRLPLSLLEARLAAAWEEQDQARALMYARERRLEALTLMREVLQDAGRAGRANLNTA